MEQITTVAEYHAAIIKRAIKASDIRGLREVMARIEAEAVMSAEGKNAEQRAAAAMILAREQPLWVKAFDDYNVQQFHLDVLNGSIKAYELLHALIIAGKDGEAQNER